MKKVLVCIVAILVCFSLTGCEDSNNSDNLKVPNNEEKTNSKNNKYALDKVFQFDDLEINISSSYEFTNIDNEYSEHNGATVVKVPITVKNLKDETHSLNTFYVNWFGSKGTEVETFEFYFDDSVDLAGELRTGASYTKYFYFLYDGDGTYTIELDNWTNKISIDMNITK